MKKLLLVLGLIGVMAAMAACDDKEKDKAEESQGRDLSATVELNRTPGALALANQLAPPASGEEYAVIITNHGEIHLRLFPEFAPMAVENFVTHARNGYYDGVIFHRVINNFMIQGGDPSGTGFAGRSIWREFFGNEFTPNLQHIRGALSMANRDNPELGVRNTNTSQFFIAHNGALDPLQIEDFDKILENHMDDEVAGLDGVVLGDIMLEEFIRHYMANGGTPHLDFRHTVFGQVFKGMDVVDAIANVPVTDARNHNYRPTEDVVMQTIEIRVMP